MTTFLVGRSKIMFMTLQDLCFPGVIMGTLLKWERESPKIIILWVVQNHPNSGRMACICAKILKKLKGDKNSESEKSVKKIMFSEVNLNMQIILRVLDVSMSGVSLCSHSPWITLSYVMLWNSSELWFQTLLAAGFEAPPYISHNSENTGLSNFSLIRWRGRCRGLMCGRDIGGMASDVSRPSLITGHGQGQRQQFSDRPH